MCGYHIGNFACTSLDSYFFLSHSVWMCLPVSGYTTTHCRCICTSLDPSFYLCFSEDFYYCSAINCLTDCTCICTSLDPPFSLTLSASGYIIDNLHVYEQARSAHSPCNCAIDLSLHFACIRTSLDSYFSLSLCLWVWMCVAVSGYIIPHCRSLDPCFLVSFSLNVFILFRVYCY